MFQSIKYSSQIVSSIITPTPPISYTGPGDVVSGAHFWVGLRAYTSASIGSNAIRLRRSSDNAEQDFVTVNGGGLDTAAITSFAGASNLFVDTLYDQTGNGRHFAQTTNADQPSFTLSGLNGKPIMTSNGSSQWLPGPILSGSQPFTVVHTVNQTDTGAQQFPWNVSAPVGAHNFGAAADTYAIFAGTATSGVACADGAWHAMQSLFDSTSSIIRVDGTETTGLDAGTGGLDGTSISSILSNITPDSFINGSMTEVGLWLSGFTGTQRSNMHNNIDNYWGI